MGFGKEIQKSISHASDGSSDAKHPPFPDTEISLLILMTVTGRSRTETPTFSNSVAKGRALPSMMGASGPSSSIRALWMPQAARPAMTCSTVFTVTCDRFPIIVHSEAGTT